ncbi:MAG TPA: hypothetical protein VJL29_15455 [Thermoguttaceae bacterium]|nr:hypothetical protein [Thermoguttaceae bacterium]
MASPETGSLYCLRCGKPVGEEPSARSRSGSARRARSHKSKSVPGSVPHPSGYDGWEMDEDLRHIGRVLGVASKSGGGSTSAPGKKHYRIDAAHDMGPGPHFDRRPARQSDGNLNLAGVLLGAVTWTTLTLGLMASACGGVLLAWSAVVRRDDLWNVGLPIALGGVLALIVALVLQLDRLAHEHRRTASQIEQFDSRLVQLRRDAAMSADARPTGSAFYAHLAGGASPQMLLSDLRSQLDLLTERLGRPDAAE